MYAFKTNSFSNEGYYCCRSLMTISTACMCGCPGLLSMLRTRLHRVCKICSPRMTARFDACCRSRTYLGVFVHGHGQLSALEAARTSKKTQPQATHTLTARPPWQCGNTESCTANETLFVLYLIILIFCFCCWFVVQSRSTQKQREATTPSMSLCCFIESKNRAGAGSINR